MNGTGTVERLRVTGGDRQTVSHAGTHLLGELADRLGLTSGESAAVPWTGERAFGHDRGRLLVQVALMLVAVGRCVADMAALRDQPDVSNATRLVWSRTVDAAHVGRFVSSHASNASATVCAESAEGGDNVSESPI